MNRCHTERCTWGEAPQRTSAHRHLSCGCILAFKALLLPPHFYVALVHECWSTKSGLPSAHFRNNTVFIMISATYYGRLKRAHRPIASRPGCHHLRGSLVGRPKPQKVAGVRPQRHLQNPSSLHFTLQACRRQPRPRHPTKQTR